MDKEELANVYASRLKKCLLAVKIFVSAAFVSVAAMLIFIAVAAGVNLQDSNLAGLVVGVAVPGFTALACIIASFICLFIAKITLNKLKGLGS